MPLGVQRCYHCDEDFQWNGKFTNICPCCVSKGHDTGWDYASNQECWMCTYTYQTKAAGKSAVNTFNDAFSSVRDTKCPHCGGSL